MKFGEHFERQKGDLFFYLKLCDMRSATVWKPCLRFSKHAVILVVENIWFRKGKMQLLQGDLSKSICLISLGKSYNFLEVQTKDICIFLI